MNNPLNVPLTGAPKTLEEDPAPDVALEGEPIPVSPPALPATFVLNTLVSPCSFNEYAITAERPLASTFGRRRRPRTDNASYGTSLDEDSPPRVLYRFSAGALCSGEIVMSSAATSAPHDVLLPSPSTRPAKAARLGHIGEELFTLSRRSCCCISPTLFGAFNVSLGVTGVVFGRILCKRIFPFGLEILWQDAESREPLFTLTRRGLLVREYALHRGGDWGPCVLRGTGRLLDPAGGIQLEMISSATHHASAVDLEAALMLLVACLEVQRQVV